MAETTRRRLGELLRKLFEILKQSPEGMSAAAALEQLAGSVQLTDYEAGNYGSGGRRFEKIVRFATVDCVKAGWLVKNRGTWIVTEAGLEAHGRFTDPEAFHKEAARSRYVVRCGTITVFAIESETKSRDQCRLLLAPRLVRTRNHSPRHNRS